MFSFPGTSLTAYYFSGIEPEPPTSPTNGEECGELSSIYSPSCAAGSPSMESSSSSISRPLSSSGCSLPNPVLSKPVIEPCEMRKSISYTFDFVDDSSCARHSYYHCLGQNCQSVSDLDARLFHGKKDKFQLKWLSDKELTYCHQTGFFGFYMLKARESTAFSAPSTKQEINKTRLISLPGIL